jgi:predicted nucleotidyltransferase
MSETSIALKSDIEKIIKISLTKLDKENIISIYLYGGYGRDEGSWVIEEVNGLREVKPYNDYDIALIVKKKYSLEKLRKLESELKNHLDVKWIDLSQYTKLKLKFFKVTIQNYDFKYASKWIYGRKDILECIPKMDVKSITLKDVETLYITRLWTLIGSFPKEGLLQMSSEKEMFFRNQMAKGILAIVDCVLVLNEEYDPSYKKRVKKLSNFSNDNKLIELANWALNEKLQPRSAGMTDRQVHELYTNVKKLFFKYFYSTLSCYYNSEISKPEDIYNFIKYNPINFIKEKIKKVIFNDNRQELHMYLLNLQGYIAFYYFEMTEERLRMIQVIMEKRFSFSSNNLDEIRVKVADLRANL